MKNLEALITLMYLDTTIDSLSLNMYCVKMGIIYDEYIMARENVI